MIYEDELPEDITDEEYALWFERSTVDGVRVGPSIEFVRSLIAAQQGHEDRPATFDESRDESE